MSCAIPPGQFQEWKKGKSVPDLNNIALARGQIEEAIGLLEQKKIASPTCCQAYQALVRARDFLDAALASSAARVPLAHYAPITDDEVEQ